MSRRCEYEYPEHSTLIALPSNQCGIWASYSSDCCGLLCLAHKDDEFCSVGAKHVLLEKLPKIDAPQALTAEQIAQWQRGRQIVAEAVKAAKGGAVLVKLSDVATEGRNTSASADQEAEKLPPSEASEDRPIQKVCGED